MAQPVKGLQHKCLALSSDPPCKKEKKGGNNRKVPGAGWPPILTNQWAPDPQQDCLKRKMGKVSCHNINLYIHTYNIINYTHKEKPYVPKMKVSFITSAGIPIKKQITALKTLPWI